jgi:hypothetical protein
MPIIGSKGAESSGGFGQFAQSGAVNYIEDVFSTYLYTANDTTQTITNGIDLSGKGGLMWFKTRNTGGAGLTHTLVDSARGNNGIFSSLTSAQSALSGGSGTITLNNNGFTINGGVYSAQGNINNGTSDTLVSWTFRKQPKFFDVVTYTGNGTAGRQISHSLGSTPGFIVVKNTGTSGPAWTCYHQSLGNTQYINLNSTDAAATYGFWNNTDPTSTYFVVGGNNVENNGNGSSYVAYLFASNAGGFGLTGTDNVVTCGSYTGNGSATGPVVTLGYEPQWLLIKSAGSTGATGWQLTDIMRGMPVGATDALLFPNSSSAEVSVDDRVDPTATGFNITTTNTTHNRSGETYIYIAIRRGPMKTPTDATTVFSPVARSGTGAATNITSPGFPPDLVFDRNRVNGGGWNWNWFDRLRGAPILSSDNTAAEASASTYVTADWLSTTMLGYRIQTSDAINGASSTYSDYALRRAPGFFDEVCYTGTGSATTVTHNLGVVPELMIVKTRSTTGDWVVYSKTTGNNYTLYLDGTVAQVGPSAVAWNNTTPTSSVFTVGTFSDTNASGVTFVAYLFATCPGVSKVGTYTGNGTTQTIDCGFTGGARFVLIKRTDSTGDWYTYDTARGMTTLTDPYLLMNSTAAETATLGSVTTVTTGFAVNATILAAINTNAATYIFLAIA